MVLQEQREKLVRIKLQFRRRVSNLRLLCICSRVRSLQTSAKKHHRELETSKLQRGSRYHHTPSLPRNHWIVNLYNIITRWRCTLTVNNSTTLAFTSVHGCLPDFAVSRVSLSFMKGIRCRRLLKGPGLWLPSLTEIEGFCGVLSPEEASSFADGESSAVSSTLASTFKQSLKVRTKQASSILAIRHRRLKIRTTIFLNVCMAD